MDLQKLVVLIFTYLHRTVIVSCCVANYYSIPESHIIIYDSGSQNKKSRSANMAIK